MFDLRVITVILLRTVNLTASGTSLCPEDAVVFSCVTDTGRLTWKSSFNVRQVYFSPDELNIPIQRDIFTLILLNVTGHTNNIYQSTAAASHVPLNYSGESITCTDNDDSSTIELVIGISLSSAIYIQCVKR